MNPITFLKKFRRFLLSEHDWETRYQKYQQQRAEFSKQLGDDVTLNEYTCLFDNTGITPIEPHYTYHPAWAARVLAQTRPVKHIDISSTTFFGTMVSAFIPVEFYDYRPANIHLSNYISGKADLTALHFESNSIESLSCMHTVEHIGLGRYGDPIDASGDKKAINELIRVLATGGNLIFVTPVGKPQIAFNAHRIYSYNEVVTAFKELTLVEFALVPDDFAETGLIKNPTVAFTDSQNWGCGCFWFTKK